MTAAKPNEDLTQAAGMAEAAGLSAGTRVLTADGELPVEYLCPGDRVITRSGLRVLRTVEAQRLSGRMLRVCRGTLGYDRPDRDALIAPGTGVLLRDWRAQALYGTPQAVVPLARLADGRHVRQVAVTDQPVFRLAFDAAEVIYADGMEIACTPVSVPA